MENVMTEISNTLAIAYATLQDAAVKQPASSSTASFSSGDSALNAEIAEQANKG